MKTLANWSACLTALAVGFLAGCSQTVKPSDIAGNIRIALDQAGLKKVTVDQDRDKGVVTLGGNVGTDTDKSQAEALARPLAGGEVVADQIAVLPPGSESNARTINSDLDKGIDQNLDAALVQGRLHKGVTYSVKSGVVTLTGEVDSQARRREVAQAATSVPHVQQVVNELQVKNQRASSSK